jgi:hypothetical protein
MQPARRSLGAEKSHRHSRQCHDSSGPSRKTEKISFQNQCDDSKHPARGPAVHVKCESKVRTSTEGHRTPLHISPEPLSKVRTSARSRNEEDPGVSRGPVLTRLQALPFTSRSGEDPLLVAHDISHRVEPDVKPCSPCIY